MIEFFVKRPVTTIMFVLVFAVLGVVSIFNLQVQKTPDMDFPIVTVTVTYPGATPQEVETLAVDKIEDAVAELSEIKNMKSYSYDNFGYITVEFLMSSDVNIKFIEVKDKVEAIRNDLPDDIEKPVIEKFDPLMEPVMDVVLSSDKVSSRDLYEFADKKFKDKFSSVEGVANVDLYGGKIRQINVILDPMLMQRKYITIYNVISSIREKNKNIPGGLLEKEDTSLSLRFLGEFQNPEEISDLLVSSGDGKRFPLSEIGEVEDSFKDIETIARFNGKNIVGLSINKVSDGNAIDISKEIRRRFPEFKKILPEGVYLEIATDTTDFIVNETNQTYINIVVGIFLTILILYFFTGHINLTFISTIVIPTSLISALFLMDSFGLTINALTLLGIATVLGTLIANAIVIIENVLEHLEHKKTTLRAAIDGTKEVSGAVLAATGTNLVVFTPIAMMSGIVGQFMRAFGLTVIFATLFSLLSSFSLTPMLCGLLLKKNDIKKGQKRKIINPFAKLAEGVNRMMERLKAEYKKIFDLIFRFPKLTVTFVVLAFLSLALIMPYVGGEFFPDSDEDMITIKITMPQGSTIERTAKTTKNIEKRVEKIPELESILTSIGQDGVENSAVVINLISSTERKRSDTDIIQELIPFTAQIPDAEINIRRGEARGGIEGDVSVNVYGPDYDKIIEISENMREIMQDSGFFRSVTSSYKMPKKEIRFFPDQEKLIEHGLTAAEIGNTIRASVYGNDSNIYKEGGQEYDINVKLDKRYSQDFDDLKQIQIISSKGMFPVTELGKIKEAKALPNIRHRDKERFIRLEGYLSKSNSGYVQRILDQEFKKIDFPDGYGYGYFGMAEHQRETGREIVKAFILAVILTYMLLAALLNSFTYPIPILLSVGTSFIGVFYALFFLGQDINIASMLGMVMLVGMVVNNSILLIDYTLIKMKEGVEVVEALWLGASRKFRAIIMTSLAIILGVAPQIKSVMPIKPSMSAVVIGGMLASILFTFIFTPVAFWYIERFSKKLFAIFNQEKPK
ncbi:MAG: efflux RND transporter permease subunit [Candidatus Omnitrophica bacterium]|nr:efflux RND transporter permease subunit [Candidatus Omnitrophota bacterium]